MADQWYCRLRGQLSGPFTQDELQFLVSRGQLQASDLVFSKPSAPGQPAWEIPGLFPGAKRQPFDIDPVAIVAEAPSSQPVRRADAVDAAPAPAPAVNEIAPPAPRPPGMPDSQASRRSQLLRRILLGGGVGAGLVLLLLLLLLLMRPAAQGLTGLADSMRGHHQRSGARPDQGPTSADGASNASAARHADAAGGSASGGSNSGASEATRPASSAAGSPAAQTATAAAEDAADSRSSDASESLPPADESAPAPVPERFAIGAVIAAPETGEEDVGSASSGDSMAGLLGQGEGGGGQWEGLLKKLRRNGLDIVLCFDSTGSMGGEINDVKDKARRIGSALLELIPGTRISICTYRDHGDLYLVQGLPLTSDLDKVVQFLNQVQADGGGDFPEAVDAGLQWSITSNKFRRQARKVILIFGDAPPHPHNLEPSKQLAKNFHQEQDGVVSTVTCRGWGGSALAEFAQIAAAGGGEAFSITDEREIMKQLMVLVFGSRHRDQVVRALRLLER